MAEFNVFGLVPPNVYTCSYVWSFSPDGTIFFGFGRKVPPDSRLKRVNRGKYIKCGAAGTAAKYHGKWVSLGGSVNRKAKTLLDAALMEINEEGATTFFQKSNIYIPWIPRERNQPLENIILIAANRLTSSNTYAFIFMIPCWTTFLRIFPHIKERQHIRCGQTIVTSSKGEIDAIASYSINDIIKMQLYAQNASTPNNHFTRYTLTTLVYWTLPQILQNFNEVISISPKIIDTIKALAKTPDINPRIP